MNAIELKKALLTYNMDTRISIFDTLKGYIYFNKTVAQFISEKGENYWQSAEPLYWLDVLGKKHYVQFIDDDGYEDSNSISIIISESGIVL